MIDRNKLRRQKAKFREATREETNLFKLFDGVYVDGIKNATQVICSINKKFYRNIFLEEHCVIVGKHEKFYLIQCTPEEGKGATIAKCLYDTIKDTTLQEKLVVIGCDGTAALTGVDNGAVRQLEEKLDRPLQWAICMLHCNKLYLRHVFTIIDGLTTSPSSFSGPFRRSLVGCVSEWGIAPFEKINNSDFPHHPNDVLAQLCSDQIYV